MANCSRGGWLRSIKYVAIKFCNNDITDQDAAHESDINKHLALANPQNKAQALLGTAFSSFPINSSETRKHVALVFEPLREPLWLMRRRLGTDDKTDTDSLGLMKAYIRIILEGLDYMHSDAHVVHTGKPIFQTESSLWNSELVVIFAKTLLIAQ